MRILKLSDVVKVNDDGKYYVECGDLILGNFEEYLSQSDIELIAKTFAKYETSAKINGTIYVNDLLPTVSITECYGQHVFAQHGHLDLYDDMKTAELELLGLGVSGDAIDEGINTLLDELVISNPLVELAAWIKNLSANQYPYMDRKVKLIYDTAFDLYDSVGTSELLIELNDGLVRLSMPLIGYESEPFVRGSLSREEVRKIYGEMLVILEAFNAAVLVFDLEHPIMPVLDSELK